MGLALRAVVSMRLPTVESRRAPLGGLALLLSLAAGCGGAASPSADGGDAGVPDAEQDASWSLAAPAEPEPLRMGECPAGWRALEGTPGCAPFAPGAAGECGVGRARLPGEAECSPVGGECPGGDGFAGDLPDDGVVYVRAGAEDGDGTRAAPYGTLSRALGAAEAGTTIALAAGRYDLGRSVPQGVTLRGACAGETVLTAESTSRFFVEAVVIVDAPDVVLRDLRVEGVNTPGVVASGEGASVTLRDVEVRNAQGFAVGVDTGAQLTARDLVVRDTRPRPDGLFGFGVTVEAAGRADIERAEVARSHSHGVFVSGEGSELRLVDANVRDTQPEQIGGAAGRGLEVNFAAQAEVSRTVFEANHDIGVIAIEGGVAQLSRVVVRNTRPGPAGTNGMGVVAKGDGEVTLERSVVARNRLIGVYAEGADAVIRGQDLVVRDTRSVEVDGRFGRALGVEQGARAEIARALFAGNRDSGAMVLDAELTLEDAVVRDTEPPEVEDCLGAGTGCGRGLQVQKGSTVTLRRLRLSDNREVGLHVAGAGTRAVIEDLVVEGTRARDDGTEGSGFLVNDGAQATARRARIEGNRRVGVAADGAETRLELREATIRETRGEQASGELGVGLAASTGAALEADGALVERNRVAGVFAFGEGTTIELRRARVIDTQGGASDGLFGRGINLQSGVQARVEDARVANNRGVGVFAGGPGTRGTLARVEVVDTAARECGDDCPAGSGGMGLVAMEEASLELREFRIVRAALCGVQVGLDGRVELHDGEVSQNSIGACVQVPGYDTDLLSDRVRYSDNEVNLDTTRLPMPGAAPPPQPTR